jgi:LysR family hydrogen peroxide-inducible transcriptional activator
VSPPVPPSEAIDLLEFADPIPSRTIAMFWRKSSAYREFLRQLAQLFADLPPGLVTPVSPTH